ncbi:barstar family protein [Pendulispora rubella]|uniref:Barstar family protein n=1 Tax=Pendulispora rubella TaxID=2741070 RepID=A0ABZ2KPF0_9BACT
MNFTSGVQRVAHLDVAATREAAAEQGVAVYELPSSGITDYVAFFDWIRAHVPLSPPIRRAGSWDALKDSLWQGLFDLKPSRIVFIWPNVDAMLPADDRDTALFILGDVAANLANAAFTQGHPKVFTILAGPLRVS